VSLRGQLEQMPRRLTYNLDNLPFYAHGSPQLPTGNMILLPLSTYLFGSRSYDGIQYPTSESDTDR